MGVKTIIGDCRDVLPTMPAESVHCIVTSPPYFGLRDYGTGVWEGGASTCKHLPRGMSADNMNVRAAAPNGKPSAHDAAILRGECPCGAVRVDRQIGLESTPDEYVVKLVKVFREARRVLRSDGTFWLNLGDSYAAQRGGTAMPAQTVAGGKSGKGDEKSFRGMSKGVHAHRNAAAIGLKHKDRLMIPARIALALQADGWWLRDEIIWHKPNPMPVSVTDRTTPAHEMIYMFSKSARYHYDMEAIKEPSVTKDQRRPYTSQGAKQLDGRAEWKSGQKRDEADFTLRQPRSVWTVPTKPFGGAHFATFPPDLIEPCIKAGCPKDGTVLDPFGGAGTTGLVSDRLGRNAILIELNPEYANLASDRVYDDAPLFATAVE